MALITPVFMITTIMYQHRRFTNVIGVKVGDFKIVGCNGRFEKFMLHLLDNHTFSVEHDKNVACTEVTRLRPSFDGRIERMLTCADDFFVIDCYVDPFL